jgi:hypothetical protein
MYNINHQDQRLTTIHLPLSLATSSNTPIKTLAMPLFLNPVETSNLPTSLLCFPVSVSGINKLTTPASSLSSADNCRIMTRCPVVTCSLHDVQEARILA